MDIKRDLNAVANTLSWLTKQLFSSSPDPSVTSGVRMLQWMAKGLLIVGALSSISYTAPTFYNIWSGIFYESVAQIATIICVVLILFLIELSFGALVPFSLDFTFSGKLNDSLQTQIGAAGLWLMIIFLGGTSMYFTYNGATTPIHAAIKDPQLIDVSLLEAQKQAAISKEEKRYDEIVSKYESQDSANLASLKLYHHNNILNIESYCKKRYGQYAHEVDDAVKKAQKDSMIKVEDFVMVKAKAPIYVRERNLAVNDARQSWNKIVETKKGENAETKKKHDTKVSAAIMLIQNFGAGSTFLFFVIQVIVSLIQGGKFQTSGSSQFQKKKFL